MAVALTEAAVRRMYPASRPGPLGEIGLWSHVVILAGDASGGNAVAQITLVDFLNKLGFSLDYLGFTTGDTTARVASISLNFRMPGDSSGLITLATVVATGTGNASAALHNPVPTIFSPIVSAFGDPNVSLSVGNPGAGINIILRAWGRVYPHQYVQRMPQATIGPLVPVPV